MKRCCLSVLLGFFAAAFPASSALLLDDTWADGSRNEQNLPAESAWYASTGASLTSSPGELLGIGTTSSRMWLTYFTPSGSPATLGVGETLRARLSFTPTNVTAAPATSRGLRVGFYNFSATGATRQLADSFSTSGIGANVPGYLLNMNFAQTFTTDNPMQIFERTDVPNVNLMGSTAQYTQLGTGPSGVLNNPSFVSGTPYTFEYTIRRTAADSVEITTSFVGGSLNVSHTAVDTSGAAVAFDALAIRVNNQNDAAQFFNFSNLEVELVPVPEPSTLGLLMVGLLTVISLGRKRSR